MTIQRPPNRLIHEKSPYLLQHAHNPVDWRPWGEDAFAEARAADRPIFLSIGYSTCHWCHVMERESFEDEEVARAVNAGFIPVKVDREERPDVDQVYMRVCQAMNGSGGWPLTLLLTPEGKPFFAATYLPKTSGRGRMGLMDLLGRAGELWETERKKLRESAEELVRRLAQAYAPAPAGELPPDVLSRAVDGLAKTFDARLGGFGGAPKFPSPHLLVFLLRRHRAAGDPRALAMAQKTLDAISAGGIRDHLGGGFHRYATDARWFSPHFEKMLYDQAGLALAFLEAHQLTGRADYARRVRETLEYVARDLSDPHGGFYCGEDADAQGEEGLFHTWTHEEIVKILGPGDGGAFAAAYGALPEGNFSHEASGHATGRNILFLPLPESGELGEPFPRLKERLFAEREKRVRPHLDDKVLAGWTAYMASAFARAGAALGEAGWVRRAGEALWFIERRMTRGGGLLRRYREGEAAIGAFAEDFSFLTRAWLDLYAATFDDEALFRALHWGEALFTRFDDGRGGLADTSGDAEALILRPGEGTDGAMPAASSVALEVAARLSLLTGEGLWEERALGLMAHEARLAGEHPTAFGAFLTAAALMLEPARTARVEGLRGEAATEALLDALRAAYAPETAARLDPPAEAGTPPRAHLCDRTACYAQIGDAEELREKLKKPFRE